MEPLIIKRDRSNFWVSIYSADDGNINIYTLPCWASIIEIHQPSLSLMSPKGWGITKKGHSNLWIPPNHLDEAILNTFIDWLHDANSHIWLDLNKNISDYFSDELDYCVASDWNKSFETKKRTSVGEAEYQLKYQLPQLSEKDSNQFSNILCSAIMQSYSFLPIRQSNKLLVTTIPAIKEKQDKLSWQMAKYVQHYISSEFLKVTLLQDKPQTKELSVSDKINLWRKIYSSNDSLHISQNVSGRDVLIVDDLYQSGTSIWAFAEFLKQQGANMIMGLVAVKSQRDSDNL